MAFSKAQIKIGSKTADVFMKDGGPEYFYSLSSLSDLIEKPARSVFYYIRSKRFKLSYGKAFQLSEYKEVNITYSLLPCDVALEYFMNWCGKGDHLAMEVVKALAKESLELRAARAFGNFEKQAETIQRLTDEQLATRERHASRREHMAFQKACLKDGFSPKACHELITIKVFGATAKESRELPMTDYDDEVWTDPQIGINHQIDPYLHQIYRDVKKTFTSYTKGTWQERVERAYNEVSSQLSLN